VLIALCGFAKTGKDTAAKGLTGFVRRAFADELKREVCAFAMSAYKINPMNCTPEQKELIRWLMVGHGRTMRAINPNYWIRYVEASMQFPHPDDRDKYTTPGAVVRMVDLPDVVITDCRYRNEAEWVESKGGRTILILRPGYDAANDEEAQSIRELIVSGLVSATIDNCGTVEELHEKIRKEVLR
jgi:hypothetical protein